MLAYAFGGGPGQIALGVLLCIGFVGAGTPIPNVKGHPAGAWVASPFDVRGPMIIFTGGISQVLDGDELKAIFAHEMFHLSMKDRVSRFVAGLIGGCAPVIIAGLLLRLSGPASLPKLGLVVLTAIVSSFVQHCILLHSELSADAESVRLTGSAEVLKRAHDKLRRSNQHVWGLGDDEIGKPEAELHTKYVAELGGKQSVLRLWSHSQPTDSIDSKPSNQDIQEVIERQIAMLQLSEVGSFIISLVDGKCTVEDVCKKAQAERGLTDFEVVRILQQLRKSGLIMT